MKKGYKKPALSVIELDILDIITTSGMDKGPERSIMNAKSAAVDPDEGWDWSMFKSY